MVDKAKPRKKKLDAQKLDAQWPPRNFVIAWKAEEEGPVLGYVVAERFVFFPTSVDSRPKLERRPNAADPAFAELFAPAVGKQVVLKAVALHEGRIGDATFRVEVNGMSGDNRFQD